MRFFDARSIVQFGLTSRQHYRLYKGIQCYLRGLLHPDHFIQLVTLQQLLSQIEQDPTTLRTYYPILIQKLSEYTEYSKQSVRNIYSYILIAIMAAEINDIKKVRWAVNHLYDDCVERAGSFLLFQYTLSRIRKALGDVSAYNAIIPRVMAAVGVFKGSYNDSEFSLRANAWLFKLTLLDKDLLLEKSSILLQQIVRWFAAQEHSTFANSRVYKDMLLTLRWLTKDMPLADIQGYVSNHLLKSLLPLSRYNYSRKKYLCLNSEDAFDILQLVDVGYFNQLLKEKKLTLWGKRTFLRLLSECQGYIALNQIIESNRDYFFKLAKTPWNRIKCQFTYQAQVIARLDATTRSTVYTTEVNDLLDDLQATKNEGNFTQLVRSFAFRPPNQPSDTILNRVYQLALTFISDEKVYSFEPWCLKNFLPQEQYLIVEKKYTEHMLLKNNSYYSFRIISQGEDAKNRQCAIDYLENDLLMRQKSLHELNDIATI